MLVPGGLQHAANGPVGQGGWVEGFGVYMLTLQYLPHLRQLGKLGRQSVNGLRLSCLCLAPAGFAQAQAAYPGHSRAHHENQDGNDQEMSAHSQLLGQCGTPPARRRGSGTG